MNNNVDNESVIVFSNAISDTACDLDIGFQEIFNGLSIATAAFLIDFCSNEAADEIDVQKLEHAVNYFEQNLRSAVRFGYKQLVGEESKILIAEN